MKILVIQNKMGIGDMVIYLPFIEAISKKFNVPVSILVKESSKAEQFLRDTNFINKIIILERGNKLKNGKHEGLVGSYNLAKDLKQYDFDKVFIFNSSLRFYLVAKFAGIKNIHQYPLFIKIFGSLSIVKFKFCFINFFAASTICWFFFVNKGY